MQEFIGPFADYVTLVYHEARNVRHLVRDGHVEKESYKRIISSLSENPEIAWQQLQRVRIATKKAKSTKRIEKIFQDRFGKDLEELVVLFRNPEWRHAKLRGGNEWAKVTRAVIEFRDAIETNNVGRASELREYIRGMDHNTGKVEAKLYKLDAYLLSVTGNQ